MLDQNISGADIPIIEPNISGVSIGHKYNDLSAECVSERLNIPLEMTKLTLKVTTQLSLRSSPEPSLNRKYRTNDRILRYYRLPANTFMDTMFATSRGGKSSRGNTSCQAFATEFGHVFTVLMKGKSGHEVSLAIKRYFNEVGVPAKLIYDQAQEQVKGESLRLCHGVGLQQLIVPN